MNLPLSKKVKKISTTRSGDLFWGYLMIAPVFLGILIFAIWPIIQSFYLSFTKWGTYGNYKWAGLSNYREMLHDPDLLIAFKNTFIYSALSVPIAIAVSILVAVLLNQKTSGIGMYRTLYFLPVVTMPAATSMVWKWLYNADYGVINYVLSFFHIRGARWLTDPQIALYSIIVVAIWSAVAYNMIIILSGLQGISSTYYEAADMDGAGIFTKFIRITLPLLSPTIFFVTVVSLINTFQAFDLVYMMIGPNSLVIKKTMTIVYLFYEDGFVNNDIGYATTIILLLFFIILIITLIQFKIQKKWVHYE